ncbi:M48 family metallopeptidase [Ancylomarina sp. 16SWW S1-10-2]|uniref:M48 family metallopeptidase n=1 Tax=Ancylomarina sp. 16SWW S1-10-2 TaxID=2499681 RepID=UPI0012AD5234|nr:M48 family metallopeptidase [Ancylomarina sp. 16SWW S1-10-2]MRT94218.1 M48 family peptidase [Ancylomarina sp. 16SWW S1-10-2]
MSTELILILILVILSLDFILERILDILNRKNWTAKIPKALEGIYDEEKYAKSQSYEKDKHRIGFISSVLSFVATILMIVLGGFAWVDDLVRLYLSNPITLALGFFAVIMMGSSLISFPFSYYSTFVIEEKYGFNRSTLKTFLLDKLKGASISAILGGGLLSLIIWIYTMTTTNFWWMAWALIAFVMVFMSMFYSSLIVPLFNKQTRLEDGELNTAISTFADKVGFKLDNIYVMDGSKRSSKGNAYFSGLGSRKRIVLFDTLIDELSTEEIVAVLAHEIGHYKKKHTLTSIVLSLLQTGIMFYIFSLLIGNISLSEALGTTNHSFHLGLIAFGILYSPISTFLGLGMNVLSRKNEYEADAYAAEHYNSKSLIDGLKKLSVSSLSNLTPHPIYVFFYYSHPTLLQRINAMQGK